MTQFAMYVTLVQRGTPSADYVRCVEADDLHEIMVKGLEAVTLVHVAAKAVADTTPPRPA